MKQVMIETARAAGAVLREHFARGCEAVVKENQSSVVTAADFASEQLILDHLRARFPDCGVLAEESGFQPGRSALTWIVDPLDGTSNFAAGLPWFGVLIGLLDGTTPVLGVAYLPVTDTLYVAEAGQGSTRDGKSIRVTAETELSRVLCTHAMDASADSAQVQREAAMAGRLVSAARNVRCTNCLLDFCYTIDGRLGGAVNHCTRIWDIVALTLLLREADGRMTDLHGEDVRFVLDEQACTRNYPVIGASPALLPRILQTLHAGS